MARHPEIFDREHEWDDITGFVTQPGAGLRLAIVRGRRRQGKSYLLRRLAEATHGFYYQAVVQEQGQALDGFGTALGEAAKVPGGRLRVDSWDDALAALAELPTDNRPTAVIIDEFPYLLGHSPDLPSLLQRFIDDHANAGPPLRLILCGSALSVMAQLLTGTQALRGRASTDILMRPFDYRTAATFWNIADPATAFLVHAVVGGTPGYRDLLPADPPQTPDQFAAWLAAGPLNPSSAIFREDDYLLTEERAMTDRALYHSVVAAIAAGNTSQTSIAQTLEREQRSVQHPLRALADGGFVVAEDDMLRSRRPIYRIADPIVRFHHVVTRPDIARFEDRRTETAWVDAEPRFRSHVLGPHFEQIARQFTFQFATADTVGGTVATVGAAVVNDAKGKAQHEVDVVAVARTPDGSRQVLAIGEAKHTIKRRPLGDLHRLEHVRGLISAKHPTAAAARLLLFSASGFDNNLTTEASDRSDVELIDLERIYRGS